MRRKILVIAPTMHNHEPLPHVADEIAEIRRWHNARVLGGDVGLLDITSELNDNDYNVIWFAAGAVGDRIHLSRVNIGYSELMQMVSNPVTRLLFLSACDTQALPNKLRAANIHILAGIAAIEDSAAASFGMKFARALYKHGSIRKAYYSLGASEDWLYLPPNGGLEDEKYYYFAFGLALGIAFLVGALAGLL